MSDRAMKKYLCSRCGKSKRASGFNKNPTNKANDGLRYFCRVCEKKRRRKQRKAVKKIAAPQTPSASFEYTNGHILTVNDLGYGGISLNLLEPKEDPDEIKGIFIPREDFLKLLEWGQKTVCFMGRT